MRAQVDQVHIADEILDYMVRLSAATRSHPLIVQGPAPGPPWRWRLSAGPRPLCGAGIM